MDFKLNKVISRYRTIFLFLLSLSNTSPEVVFANEAKIINAIGKVTINGFPAKIGDVVPVGSTVETADGAIAVVSVGEDDVMKITSRSVLKIEDSVESGTQLKTSLLSGRLEGVKKIENEIFENNPTLVETSQGTLQIKGGRYFVEVGGEGESKTTFLAVDGHAKVLSNTRSILGEKSAEAMTLSKGEFISVQQTGQSKDDKKIFAVSNRTTFLESEVRTAMPSIANINQLPNNRIIASNPLGRELPIPQSFRELRPPVSAPINQDPLTPIIPREKTPKVTVKFQY